MTTNHAAESELAHLRADLLEFVLKEVTARLVEDPTLPASVALDQHVATSVERRLGVLRFDPANVVAEILAQLRPELLVQLRHEPDAASGARPPLGYTAGHSSEVASSRPRLTDLLAGAAAGAALLLLGLASGFFMAGGHVGAAPSPAPTAIREVAPLKAQTGRDVPTTNMPSDGSAGGAPAHGQ